MPFKKHISRVWKHWGHRGICNQTIMGVFYLENTLPSIQKALEGTIIGIECDIQLTQDKIPVISHDKSLDRVYKLPQNIEDLTLPQLNALLSKAKADKATIPTLREILEYVGQTKPKKAINIEIKTPNTANVILACCKKAINDKLIQNEQILLSSFNLDELQTCVKDATFEVAILIEDESTLQDKLEQAKEWDVKHLHMNKKLISSPSRPLITQLSQDIFLYSYQSLSEIPEDLPPNIKGCFVDNTFS